MSPLIPKRLRRELAELNRSDKISSDKPVPVSVGGAPYQAVLTGGVLRFKSNWAVARVADRCNSAGDGADMNSLALAFMQEKLPLREYAEFHMLMGYSLSGFCELSSFEDLEVKTPNWTREGRTPWKTK